MEGIPNRSRVSDPPRYGSSENTEAYHTSPQHINISSQYGTASRIPSHASTSKSTDHPDIHHGTTQQEIDKQKVAFPDDQIKRKFSGENDIKKINDQFEQRKQAANELIEWTETFTKWFDLREKWVQDGIAKLGIELKDFENAYKQLQQFTLSPPLDHLGADNELVVASLQSIRDRLKGGIPVEDIPRQINGLARVETSGHKMNCLIHALLKVSNPEQDMESIKKQAKNIRKDFILKMNDRVNSAYQNNEFEAQEMDELVRRLDAVINKGMLMLGSYDGAELINYLREHEIIDPNCGLLVYELDKERKIRCNDHYPVSSSKKPYSLFLHQDFHFEAMIEQ
jgi:hypothetical protein